MKNGFIFLILFSIGMKHVISLNCYVTDMAAIKARNMEARSVIKDCKDFLYELEEPKMQGIMTYIEDRLRCITVKIDSEEANINFQGCSAQNECGNLTDQLKEQLPTYSLHLDRIACSECKGDLCNSGDMRSIIIKKKSPKTYIIIALVAAIITASVVIAISRILSKRPKKSGHQYSLIVKA